MERTPRGTTGRPDMKLKTRLPTLVLAAFLTGYAALPAAGQDSRGFKPAEVTKLAKVLGDLRTHPEYPTQKQEKKKVKAQKAFDDQIEKLKKAYAGEDILSFTTGWQDVFAKIASTSKIKRPAGKGRVKKGEMVFQKVRGRALGFEYAVYIPSGYKLTQRWPVIVAIPTKGSTGAQYLNEVWINKKRCPKDVYDQFIFVAPTIGERTIPKSKKDKRYQKRIEPFSGFHRACVALALGDALSKYNIDTDRMYLDGAGLGGEAAAWLGVMQTKLFAGIAVRNARPAAQKDFSKPAFLGNLKNQAPMLIVDRKDGAYAGTDGEAERKRIDHQIEVDQLPIEWKILDALPDDKTKRLAKGTQSVDPVHEATKDIAAFFLKQKRNLYPPELGYITYDLRSFKQTPWYRLQKATANPKDGSVATVRGTLDREAGTATFVTTNVESFRFYLNDILMDLDKNVKIIVNGKEVETRKVERSLEYMLKFNEANAMDPSLVMVGEVRVNVPVGEETDENGEGK